MGAPLSGEPTVRTIGTGLAPFKMLVEGAGRLAAALNLSPKPGSCSPLRPRETCTEAVIRDNQVNSHNDRGP